MKMGRKTRSWLGMGAAGLAIAGAGAAVAVASNSPTGAPTPAVQQAPATQQPAQAPSPESEGANEIGEMEGRENERAPTGPAAVSEAEAKATARAEVPGGTVLEVEREVEYGVDAYEVTVQVPDGNPVEVSVDATSGEVVHVGPDD